MDVFKKVTVVLTFDIPIDKDIDLVVGRTVFAPLDGEHLFLALPGVDAAVVELDDSAVVRPINNLDNEIHIGRSGGFLDISSWQGKV